MDTKEACLGTAEEDENIVIDWYLDYSFYIMAKRSVEIECLCGMIQIFLQAPSNKPLPRISPIQKY